MTAAAKGQVRSAIGSLTSSITDWTGLDGARVATGVLTAIAFALISAHILGGD